MISEEEYDLLKSFGDNWEWIARDENSNKATFPNELWLYECTPKKEIQDWLGGGGASKRFNYDNLFQFIQWGDEEPYSIAELIREYELARLDELYPPVKEDEDMEKVEELCQEDHDPVHRPQHYMQGHIETIDKIKLLLTPEEYLGYLKGNVIKYDRAPFKGNMEQDYDKQKVYYDWALAELED